MTNQHISLKIPFAKDAHPGFRLSSIESMHCGNDSLCKVSRSEPPVSIHVLEDSLRTVSRSELPQACRESIHFLKDSPLKDPDLGLQNQSDSLRIAFTKAEDQSFPVPFAESLHSLQDSLYNFPRSELPPISSRFPL